MSAHTHDPWRLGRGASVLAGGGVRFAVWAPAADGVAVHLLDDDRLYPLASEGDGMFAATVAEARPDTRYRLRLERSDGTVERPDPVSRSQPEGVHGPSRVVDPAKFRWSDASWRGVGLRDLVLYELHVGTASGAGTFDGAAALLPTLADLGVTGVELMPVAEFPGTRNWGYDGVLPYAPQSSYGGPEGLRRFVDAAHAAGLAVVLDVVYNHLGPEGNHLADFGPYFTDRHRTPWGPAVNYDDADSEEVRRYVVDNARYWIDEFHVDGLRLDAVHAIYDMSARHILEELTDSVHAQAAAAGRTALVVAESDLNDPRLVRNRARGGFGLDAQWSDDFHHALHVALTGERHGYYADFDGPPALATAIRDRWVYDGRRSAFRRRRHGAPATDLPPERFVVCAQNHDQIGNRARGERLAALVDPPRVRLAAALVVLSPFVPLLFMGEEWGETNPFLYFTSHGDPALVEAVREGRRREFAGFAWQGEVPDPQAERTFDASRPDRSRVDVSGHREILALHRDLLALRRERFAAAWDAPLRMTTGPGAAWIRLDAGGGVPVRVFNVSDRAQDVPTPPDGPWRLVLTTAAHRYGGGGDTVVDGATIHVPAWSAAVVDRAST